MIKEKDEKREREKKGIKRKKLNLLTYKKKKLIKWKSLEVKKKEKDNGEDWRRDRKEIEGRKKRMKKQEKKKENKGMYFYFPHKIHQRPLPPYCQNVDLPSSKFQLHLNTKLH